MKQSATAVLEPMSWFDTSFCTEPYEAAWADEAIFFIKVHEMPEAMRLGSAHSDLGRRYRLDGRGHRDRDH